MKKKVDKLLTIIVSPYKTIQKHIENKKNEQESLENELNTYKLQVSKLKTEKERLIEEIKREQETNTKYLTRIREMRKEIKELKDGDKDIRGNSKVSARKKS